MKVVKFKLREDIAKENSLDKDYIYKANKHPEISNIIIVHFEKDGEERQVYYPVEDVSKNFKESNWIIVE